MKQELCGDSIVAKEVLSEAQLLLIEKTGDLHSG